MPRPSLVLHVDAILKPDADPVRAGLEEHASLLVHGFQEHVVFGGVLWLMDDRATKVIGAGAADGDTCEVAAVSDGKSDTCFST
jgi:hypothetical protein